MTTDAPIRLIDHLPAIYRDTAADSDLARLLAVFEELLFTGAQGEASALAGFERVTSDLPALFAPLGLAGAAQAASPPRRTPDAFLPWLATWLAFTPRALFEPARLRQIVAGIVPLHGRRGTRAYLVELLELCFEEIARVQVDDQGLGGLRIGRARLGTDSLLTDERPFWFSVEIALRADAADAAGEETATGAGRGRPRPAHQLEHDIRAVIDFAKPAHTDYQLRLIREGPGAVGRDAS